MAPSNAPELYATADELDLIAKDLEFLNGCRAEYRLLVNAAKLRDEAEALRALAKGDVEPDYLTDEPAKRGTINPGMVTSDFSGRYNE